jgi:predicted phosphodiesterase
MSRTIYKDSDKKMMQEGWMTYTQVCNQHFNGKRMAASWLRDHPEWEHRYSSATSTTGNPIRLYKPKETQPSLDLTWLDRQIAFARESLDKTITNANTTTAEIIESHKKAVGGARDIAREIREVSAAMKMAVAPNPNAIGGNPNVSSSTPPVKPAKATAKAEATPPDTRAMYLNALEANKKNSPPARNYFSVKPATKKILSLSDLHFPFEDMDAINYALDQDGNADILVLNGDIIDGYCVSSYSKTQNIPLSIEYNKALDLLRTVSGMFEEVVLVKGNHDNRVDRYLSSRIDPWAAMLANNDILDKLSKGIVYDEYGKETSRLNFGSTKITYNNMGLPWMSRVGKTIFMHPDTYLSQAGATVARGVDHISNYVDASSFDCIVMGHTHKQAKMVEKNKLLIEQGALCKTMSYQKQAEFKKRPSITGYAVVYQDADGAVRPDLTNFIYLKTIDIFQ